MRNPAGDKALAAASPATPVRWWRDWQFAAAWAAAPLAWWTLARLGVPLGDPAWVRQSPWLFGWLVGLGPLLEEVVFRGGLQPALAQRMARARWPAAPVLANLVTSLAFAALHGLSHPAPWAAAVFLPSLVFGHFRQRHGGLGSPVALHVGYNAGYFLLFFHPASG